jgi:hypothetical protein
MGTVSQTPTEGQTGELLWVRLKLSRLQFELQAGETVVATLVWNRGSRALAQWGESRYRFSRQGWLRPRILVHAEDSTDGAEPIATFLPRGGTLTFPDGRPLVWKKPRKLTGDRIWVDSAATELIRFHPAKRSSVAVTTQAEAVQQPELPLLILLGQYLIVLAGQDAEAASAAGIVAVIASS